MKYFIIAGEASGDLHGASLITAIKHYDPQATFQAWGGDNMERAGAKILNHIRHLAFFGFWEVIVNLRSILASVRQCKEEIARFQPDVVIGIDYPGFNLKLLRWAKENGYKTVQYVLPHVWVWKENRIETLKKYMDEVLVILPFEQEFCAVRGLKTTYIGHPLIEYFKDFQAKHPSPTAKQKTDILILAGSRRSEVNLFLPILVKVIAQFPDEHFAILRSPQLDLSYYEKHLKNAPQNIRLIVQPTFEALQSAKAAIVKSGTSTLEATLSKVPFLVVYKTSLFTGILIKLTFKIRFASLPNIIMGKEVVKELLQYKFNVENVSKELRKLLNDSAYTHRLIEQFDAVEKKLSCEDRPSHLAAKTITNLLKQSS